MNSCLWFFKQVVHVNLNLSVLVLLAWLLLGKKSGPKTSLFVWCTVALRFLIDPFLCPENEMIPPVNFADQGSLSLGVGLGLQSQTLLCHLGLGTESLSVGDLAVLSLGEELCRNLGAVMLSILLFVILARLLQLLANPGTREGLVWCERAGGPCVRGWLTPSIVLPYRLLKELEPAEIEAVVAHEKAHLRAGDHRLFALLYLLRSWCWLVWPLKIVLDGVELSIEQLRDKEASQEVGPTSLGRALVKLASLNSDSRSPAFNGSAVMARLQALRPGLLRESWPVALTSLMLLKAVFL